MSRQSRLTAQADVFSSSTSIQQLAREALVRVASRAGRVTNSNDQVAVDILFKAATGGEPLACSVAARKMLADGVPPERICEKYIPAVARQMGDDWCTDDLSFTTVTIGTARLQYLLREIGRIGMPDDLHDGNAPSLLVLMTPGMDHTLGVMVLANQLRRRGISVSLSLGESVDSIIEKLRTNTYHGVFISAGMMDSLDSVRAVVNRLRATFNKLPPVVLGGCTEEIASSADSETGVDRVTNDVEEAIGFCGLTPSPVSKPSS